MKFLDQAKIYIKAGNGGSGSASFRREKFVEYGGPDGGDGGDGGSIIVQSDRNLNTLIDFRYAQHFKAQHGKPGSKRNKTGANGEDLILKVPLGTQVYEEDNNTLIYDFTKNKEKYLVASCGKGGLGNVRFKSSTNRAPRKKTNGKLGEEFWIWLQFHHHRLGNVTILDGHQGVTKYRRQLFNHQPANIATLRSASAC